MIQIIFLESIAYDQPKRYALCIEIRALLITNDLVFFYNMILVVFI
jgi:hypothetical protein